MKLPYRSIGAIFALAIAVCATTAAAATSCPNQISTCGCTITTAGNYTVASDLSQPFLFTDCITIDAPNVRLDLAGKSITVPPPGPGPQPLPPQSLVAGVHLTKRAANAIVAGHGASITGFTWGIFVESTGATVGGLTASSNQFAGVMLLRAPKARVFDIDASGNSGNGIEVLGSRDCVVESFTADNNSGSGILIGTVGGCGKLGIPCSGPMRHSSAIEIFGGEANSNQIGIQVEQGSAHSQIIGNTAKSNSTDDLSDGSGDCTHNLWFGNTFTSSNPACIE